MTTFLSKEERAISGLEFLISVYGDINIEKSLESELGEYYEVTVHSKGLLNGGRNRSMGKDIHDAIIELMKRYRDTAHEQAQYLDAQIKGFRCWRNHDSELTTNAD